MRIKIKKAMAN